MTSRLHAITIDDREPNTEKTTDALSVLGVPARVERLPAGDFQWVVEPSGEGEWGVCVVERKTISDFIASLNDGRIAGFIEHTGGVTPPTHMQRFLLLEGDQFNLWGYGGRDWTPEQLDDALVSVQSAGVVVVRSQDSVSTPVRLSALWHKSGRERSTLLRVVRPEISNTYLRPEQRDAVRLLMCLPGWGEDRARATLGHFLSVRAVLDAIRDGDIRAFASVAGVGKGLVLKAKEWMEKEVG